MTQTPEEGDAADAIDFKDIDLNEVAANCPSCGYALEDGECINAYCEASSWYEEDLDEDEPDGDDKEDDE